MKKIHVADLVTGTEFDDFFLLRQVSVKTGSNQKQYLDMILGDNTGDVNAKKWDAGEKEIALVNSFEGTKLIKVRASVSEWQNRKQLRVTKFREATPDDDLDISEFIKAAPERGEKMYDEILEKAYSIEDEDLRNISLAVLQRNREKLLYYPAASKNHHAEKSGLLFHVKRMLLLGEKACEVYDSLRRDWVITGVIIHDIEKLNEIISDEMGISPGYSFRGNMLGHITQGVMLLDRMAEEFGICEEKAVMLEHMILTHHYEPEFGSPKRPMFPEAELLHYLDILDARLFDMDEALSATEPGGFSDKVWTLENRKIYRSTF